jgi:hypothetical protein
MVLLFISWDTFKAGLEVQSVDDIVYQANRIAQIAQEADPYAGSTQYINVQFNSLFDIAAFLPVAAFTALFRPLPGELMNPFGLLASIENAWLLVLVFLSFRHSRWPDVRHPVILWAIMFLVFWAAVYGFVSSYNLGTGMRYRQQIFPILLAVLLYLSQRTKPQPSPGPRPALPSARCGSDAQYAEEQP